MITIDNKHDIGDEVYLKTDIDQKKRLIYAFEITTEKNILVDA